MALCRLDGREVVVFVILLPVGAADDRAKGFGPRPGGCEGTGIRLPLPPLPGVVESDDEGRECENALGGRGGKLGEQA